MFEAGRLVGLMAFVLMRMSIGMLRMKSQTFFRMQYSRKDFDDRVGGDLWKRGRRQTIQLNFGNRVEL